MPILNEVEFQHRTRLWSDIRQYVGKGYFIHFGVTPKVGVRATGKFHTDPAGVYFYNLDWLAKHPRFAEGEQYATNWQYWTIVERYSDDHGVVLSRLSWDDLTQIAAKNNWPNFEQWERDNYEKMRPPHNTPAGMFWDYIKACSPMSRGGKDLPTQNKALRGISFVEDDGLGIIHGSEPYQMALFDPRIIRVVATGDQGPDRFKTDKLMGGNRFAFVELLKKLRGEYGGEINWSQKLPSLSFSVSGATFKLSWAPSAWDAKMRMETNWGRARKTFTFDKHKFEQQSMDVVMAFFTGIVDKIAALAKAKKDLFFTPVLSEKDAVAGVKSLIEPDGFAFTTEIDNDHKQMTVMAEKTIGLGEKSEMLVMVYCLTGETLRWAVNIKIGHHTIAAARSPEDVDRVAGSLKKNFDESLEGVQPNTDSYGGKFYYDEEYRAFIGMVADISGIKSLRDDYADEVEAWRSYKNKEELYRDIARIY